MTAALEKTPSAPLGAWPTSAVGAKTEVSGAADLSAWGVLQQKAVAIRDFYSAAREVMKAAQPRMHGYLPWITPVLFSDPLLSPSSGVIGIGVAGGGVWHLMKPGLQQLKGRLWKASETPDKRVESSKEDEGLTLLKAVDVVYHMALGAVLMGKSFASNSFPKSALPLLAMDATVAVCGVVEGAYAVVKGARRVVHAVISRPEDFPGQSRVQEGTKGVLMALLGGLTLCGAGLQLRNVAEKVSLLSQPKLGQAIVLNADPDTDHNGVFKMGFIDPPKNLDMLSYRYNVTRRTVWNIADICRTVDEVAGNGQGPVKLLLLRGHGNQWSVQLSKRSDGYLRADTVRAHRDCLDGLAADAKIVLESCSTGGSTHSDTPNIAQAMATVWGQGREVIAPTRPIASAQLAFAFDKEGRVDASFDTNFLINRIICFLRNACEPGDLTSRWKV